MVSSLAKTAIVVGVDGFIIEVYHEPKNVLLDGEKTLTSFSYRKLVKELKIIAKAVGRDIA